MHFLQAGEHVFVIRKQTEEVIACEYKESDEDEGCNQAVYARELDCFTHLLWLSSAQKASDQAFRCVSKTVKGIRYQKKQADKHGVCG